MIRLGRWDRKLAREGLKVWKINTEDVKYQYKGTSTGSYVTTRQVAKAKANARNTLWYRNNNNDMQLMYLYGCTLYLKKRWYHITPCTSTLNPVALTCLGLEVEPRLTCVPVGPFPRLQSVGRWHWHLAQEPGLEETARGPAQVPRIKWLWVDNSTDSWYQGNREIVIGNQNHNQNQEIN